MTHLYRFAPYMMKRGKDVYHLVPFQHLHDIHPMKITTHFFQRGVIFERDSKRMANLLQSYEEPYSHRTIKFVEGGEDVPLFSRKKMVLMNFCFENYWTRWGDTVTLTPPRIIHDKFTRPLEKFPLDVTTPFEESTIISNIPSWAYIGFLKGSEDIDEWYEKFRSAMKEKEQRPLSQSMQSNDEFKFYDL
jgi:hypothetical protein